MTVPPCLVCSGVSWRALPNPGTQSMASDWRIVAEPLGRSVCETCGLARRLPSSNASLLFDSGYELYAHAPGDPREHARQSEYAHWIDDAVGGAPSRVLDVGCGNGSLLRALGARWHATTLLGCDPSPEAIGHAGGDGVRVWRGHADDLPADATADLVVTINVIEHTSDPLRFLQALRQAVEPGGRLIVVCPDGDRPGVELLFADHLFSFAGPHLEALLHRAGFEIAGASVAPASLGAFQMMVGLRRNGAWHEDRWRPCHVRGREEYLERWRDLDEHLLARLGPQAVCFGTGEAAGLLRSYAPRAWARVKACTADRVSGEAFGAVPTIPLDAVDPGISLLLGVRPSDQPRLAERLRARFPHVIEWYDLVDEQRD